MHSFRRILVAAAVVAGLAGLSLAMPANAQTRVKYEKKLSSTIMMPGWDTGTWFGAGYGNWAQTEDDMAVVRQTCPAPGDFDGYVWRFFDLKGGYTKFKAAGPTPMFTQDTAAGIFHDYDIDLWLLDNKCNRIDVDGSNLGGGIELQSTRKPAHYAVIVYWYGHELNMPVTLEIAK